MTIPTDTPLGVDNKSPVATAEAAADWCIRMQADDCSEEERAAFAQWLKQDPEHERAYHKTLRIWTLGEQLTPTVSATRPPPANSQRASPRQPLFRPKVPAGRWQQAAWALSLAILLLIPLGYGGWMLGWVPDDYHRYSADQAQRAVTLPDGTQVTMNINTRIHYSHYRDKRHVSISGNGEAFFEVTHNTEHPFEVSAGSGTITVTGTAFNVWRYRKDVVVTVTAGSVVVSSQGTDVRLTPGMRAGYGRHNRPQAEPGDIAHALAWTSGKLILDDVPLAQAMPQIGRYLDESITFADAAVADLRIGGIYNIDGLDELMATLPQALPLSIEKRWFGGIVLSSRP